VTITSWMADVPFPAATEYFLMAAIGSAAN
jgi:hypothetical protein